MLAGELVDIALVPIETCPSSDGEAEQQKLTVALYEKDATTVKRVLTGLDTNFV